jgi:LmbE family N-acetylglucosaminyl deacetylase|tara:strand:+ start:58 stop:618 length:561 start_codon:yes stop_codon:yes gene_type:complete
MKKRVKKFGNFNNVMIVAHPDDELIFGGSELIKNKNYKVICITNQDNEQRFKEFTGLMKELKISYEILDHPDKMTIKTVRSEYITYIKNFLLKNKNKINKIITHNKKGEYGHNFHKAVNKMVTDICNNNDLNDKLFYFHNGKNKIEEKLIKKKLELMEKYYPSQFKVLARLKLKKSIENESLYKFN